MVNASMFMVKMSAKASKWLQDSSTIQRHRGYQSNSSTLILFKVGEWTLLPYRDSQIHKYKNGMLEGGYIQRMHPRTTHVLLGRDDNTNETQFQIGECARQCIPRRNCLLHQRELHHRKQYELFCSHFVSFRTCANPVGMTLSQPSQWYTYCLLGSVFCARGWTVPMPSWYRRQLGSIIAPSWVGWYHFAPWGGPCGRPSHWGVGDICPQGGLILTLHFLFIVYSRGCILSWRHVTVLGRQNL